MPNPTIPITSDVFIDRGQPTVNFNAVGNCNVRLLYISSTKTECSRSLLYAAIPPEIAVAEIYKAELRLRWFIEGSAGAAATLYRVTQEAWTEAGATWNKYDGVTNWTLAGGDYDTTEKVQFTVQGPLTARRWQEIDITTWLIDIINNHSRNAHMLLRLDDESAGVNTGGVFVDGEIAGGSEWERPHIVIVRPPFGQPVVV